MKLTRPKILLEFSRAISRINIECNQRSTLMMEAEEISEMLVLNSTSTRPIARGDFSTFIRRERFKSYIKKTAYD
jgi:hypothetical protein